MGRNIIKTQARQSDKIIRKQVSNIPNLEEELTVSQLNKTLKKLKNKGLATSLKGKGSGGIKLGFE